MCRNPEDRLCLDAAQFKSLGSKIEPNHLTDMYALLDKSKLPGLLSPSCALTGYPSTHGQQTNRLGRCPGFSESSLGRSHLTFLVNLNIKMGCLPQNFRCLSHVAKTTLFVFHEATKVYLMFNVVVTGRVYEYSTRTHERRWVNESENDSHFKLKTEEK